MKILHICAGWQKWNGAANIARMIMDEQRREGHEVSSATWAKVRELRATDEVWIHCGWLPCLWWAALWGRNVHWMPEACYDPVRLSYHGWKKWLAGPIERFSLRRAKVLVATCEAEKGWIESYLGRRCPPIELTDIKRFFKLGNGERGTGNGKKDALHILYLGRKHPLKGVEYLETAVAQLTRSHPSSDRLRGSLRSGDTFPVPHSPQLKVVSNAFGDELERVWDWCDVLVLPTLSDNFGLVIAEALERGKCVITTDGAPAWGENLSRVERVDGGMWSGYGGRLIYLKGYRDGTPEDRVRLLKSAIENLLSRASLTPPAAK